MSMLTLAISGWIYSLAMIVAAIVMYYCQTLPAAKTNGLLLCGVAAFVTNTMFYLHYRIHPPEDDVVHRLKQRKP